MASVELKPKSFAHLQEDEVIERESQIVKTRNPFQERTTQQWAMKTGSWDKKEEPDENKESNEKILDEKKENETTNSNEQNTNTTETKITSKHQTELSKGEKEEEDLEEYIFRAIKFMSAPNRSMNLQKIVEILESGVSVDIRDETGKTPLMLACSYGHEQLVSVLLSRGANALLKDNSGKSALHHSSYKTIPYVERVLEQKFPQSLFKLCSRTISKFYSDEEIEQLQRENKIPLKFQMWRSSDLLNVQTQSWVRLIENDQKRNVFLSIIEDKENVPTNESKNTIFVPVRDPKNKHLKKRQRVRLIKSKKDEHNGTDVPECFLVELPPDGWFKSSNSFKIENVPPVYTQTKGLPWFESFLQSMDLQPSDKVPFLVLMFTYVEANLDKKTKRNDLLSPSLLRDLSAPEWFKHIIHVWSHQQPICGTSLDTFVSTF